MIVIGGAILGAFLGVRTAKKRGGVRADLWQYGTVYAIAFALGGLIVTIVVEKLVA